MELNDNEDPDLYLKFDDTYYKKHKAVFMNITRGDYFAYNGTFIFEGNKNHVPLLEGFGLSSLKKHININPHIHHSGRYSLDADNDININQTVYSDMSNLVADENVDIHHKQHETHH